MSTDDDIQPSLDHILYALRQWEQPNLPDLIRWMANVHMMQAQVIQYERGLRERTEMENVMLREEVTRLKTVLGYE